MKIEQRNNEDKGIFLAKDGDKIIGEMSYVWSGSDSFIIDHTGVNGKYQNQGVGSKLVNSAVIYARENQLTILPLCPFARAEFDRHPDYAEVRKR
ncbi:N-acetyltransferase [Paludibacter sp. 221]|uniref:GNAT family N-acetyltransferase n=1 Tax=Paludibacter sp. 221 TaxID=2302939 RepID=UPI0013D8B49C|nr:GNAT family N-acetyltransferase [Paludibacter sp. 221]NDV46491.1 N-acetyltransferase [Paludibacter sp. 221]